ncbi:MAG: hypothetical protein ACRDP1_01205 [Nocardioidaceae bacterium]
MVVLGLVLLAAAVVVAGGVVIGGDTPISVHLLGLDMHTSTAGVFLGGAITMLVALVALWLMRLGLRRSRRRRRDIKRLRGTVETQDKVITRQGRAPGAPDDAAKPAPNDGTDEHFASTPRE